MESQIIIFNYFLCVICINNFTCKDGCGDQKASLVGNEIKVVLKQN